MKRPHYKDFTKSTLQLYKDSTTLYTRFVTPLYYTKLPRYKMKKRFIHFHVPQSPPKQFSQIEIHFTTFLLQKLKYTPQTRFTSPLSIPETRSLQNENDHRVPTLSATKP